MPASPEPGCTDRPSSVNTFVSGAMSNCAVGGGGPFIVTATPTEPSVDPIASMSMRCFTRCSNSLLTSAVHMTPDDTTSLSEDASYGALLAAASSNAWIIGLQNASPTITTTETFSTSVVFHTAWA